MNRNLSDWASIAEILSGIAVVISLVLLLFEVRGNSEAVRAATFQNVSDSITQIADFAHDRELVDLYSRGIQGTLDNPIEKTQFGLLLVSQVRRWENAYFQRDYMHAEIWQGMQNALDRTVSTQGFNIWWNELK